MQQNLKIDRIINNTTLLLNKLNFIEHFKMKILLKTLEELEDFAKLIFGHRG